MRGGGQWEVMGLYFSQEILYNSFECIVQNLFFKTDIYSLSLFFYFTFFSNLFSII